MLGSGAARSCQQPGLAPALARGDYVEIGERDGELAGAPMSQRCCVTVASLPASGTFCVRRPTRQAEPPASRAAGLPSPPGGNLPHVLPRAGLIDINGHDSPHSPTQRNHVDTRSHRARWPTGLARHSKPNRPAEIAPDVESDAQM